MRIAFYFPPGRQTTRIRQGFGTHRCDFSKIVEGHADKLKITTPSDFELAEHFLSVQGDNR